jgi:hypothetical protein
MPDAESDGETLGRPESVKLHLSFVRDVVLADESERQQNLDTKAGTLAGFVAVALSLEAALGATVFLGHELDCGAKSLLILFFVIAVAGLGASGLFALLAVLAPKDYLVLDTEQINQMATQEEMRRPPDEIREKQLVTLTDVITHARSTNEKKAKGLRYASLSLAIAIGAIAAQGLTLPFA